MTKIHPYLLLGFSLCIQLIYGALRNLYSKKFVKSHADFYGFCALSNAFSAIALLVFSGGIAFPSAYTVLLGFLYGIATMAGTALNLLAFVYGPFSYTTVIVSSSMILPALSGAVFWDEPIRIGQYIGAALILVTLILSIDNREDNRRSSVKWLLCCLGSFVCSGLIGILQKAHQSSVYRDEIDFFLCEAFLVAAVFAWILHAVYRKRASWENQTAAPLSWKGYGLLVGVTGVGYALVNLFNMYLSGALPSIVFFPIFNGANVVLSTLIGVVVFRERMRIKQWCGLFTGILAVLFLCNLF